jgi:hypothetical protein
VGPCGWPGIQIEFEVVRGTYRLAPRPIAVAAIDQHALTVDLVPGQAVDDLPDRFAIVLLDSFPKPNSVLVHLLVHSDLFIHTRISRCEGSVGQKRASRVTVEGRFDPDPLLFFQTPFPCGIPYSYTYSYTQISSFTPASLVAALPQNLWVRKRAIPRDCGREIRVYEYVYEYEYGFFNPVLYPLLSAISDPIRQAAGVIHRTE